MIDQFWMDAASHNNVGNDVKELKKFCFRTLNLLALKVCLVSLIEFGPWRRLDLPSQWAEVFELMSEPGVLKVIRFAAACMAAGDNALGEQSVRLVNSYCSLLSRYGPGLDARSEVRDIIRQFDELFLVAVKSKVLQEAQHRPWLFSTGRAGSVV
jgi:hypothetical protein